MREKRDWSDIGQSTSDASRPVPSISDLSRFSRPAALAVVVLVAWAAAARAADEAGMLKLNRRLHVPEQRGDGSLVYKPNWGPIEWDPKKTAFIICDMWDQHWCQGAARRVVELAEPVNKFAHAARKRGVLVIHAPSTCVDFYKDTPERRRAQAATLAKPPVVLSQATRWGTRWCYPVEGREGELPIDDSDMGCDCATKCEIRTPWTRQIKLIDIEDGDAISDDGQEVYNLLAERGIDNVLIAGVHLNMCVLGRSFAIRQLVLAGKKVMLVRDLTDTMYNAKSRPFVDHFTGTDLVVEHVEKYWCPTITSVDLLGGQPFRFAEDKRR